MQRAALALISLGTIVFLSLSNCSLSPALEEKPLPEWRGHPAENISLVDTEKILNIKLSRWEPVGVRSIMPLQPDTEIVRISFKTKFEGRLNADGQALISLNLQQPIYYGNYVAGARYVNSNAGWESHELVQVFRTDKPEHKSLPYPTLPEDLVVEIKIGEGTGVLQVKDFTVQELQTYPNPEARKLYQR
ncbi:MAG TPA: hypothetical protein VGH16_18755 [Candidatus Binatia bacterium]|jgi:hypothetical protein